MYIIPCNIGTQNILKQDIGEKSPQNFNSSNAYLDHLF